MEKRLFLFFIVVVLNSFLSGGSTILFQGGDKVESSVVIVIDSCSFTAVRGSLEKYCRSLQEEGLGVYYMVFGDTITPEEIKKSLVDLYVNDNIEGAIFIGNVPIPMIQGAQHLTSAFKMNEKKFGLRRSSVPSDCYYTDFDLEFEFICRDSVQPELFYYELASESPQVVEKEIYSGRIKPFSGGGEFYREIKRYLDKVVAVKHQKSGIDSIMVFTGHGYHSESLVSWANEYLMLREQFPGLFGCPGGVCFLYHDMFSSKDEVLQYLSMEGLDIAIFHAHGGRDAQYLFGLPEGKSLEAKVDYIKRFLRGKLRDARRRGKSIRDVKNYYMRVYGVPEVWFEGAFDDSLIREDSIASAMLDIYIDDLEPVEVEPKVVILDQCFTGDFTSSRYIAGEYLFGKGNTVVVIANSVNVKQDIWSDECLGLLGYGVRIGLIHKMNNFIENHILGDPTFAFTGSKGERFGSISKKRSLRYWKRLLRSGEVPLRVLALREIFKKLGEGSTRLLIDVYMTDSSFNVRLEALKLLASLRSEEFEKVLWVSIKDQNEMVRKFSVIWMGKIGDVGYAKALIKRATYDNSTRVRRLALEALEAMPYEQVLNKLNEEKIGSEAKEKLKEVLSRNYKWLSEELLPVLEDREKPVEERLNVIRAFRNYNFLEAVEPLLAVATDESEELEVRLGAIEALGWYQYSRKRRYIVESLETCLQKTQVGEVRSELLKTINRLKMVPNNPLTP